VEELNDGISGFKGLKFTCWSTNDGLETFALNISNSSRFRCSERTLYIIKHETTLLLADNCSGFRDPLQFIFNTIVTSGTRPYTCLQNLVDSQSGFEILRKTFFKNIIDLLLVLTTNFDHDLSKVNHFLR